MKESPTKPEESTDIAANLAELDDVWPEVISEGSDITKRSSNILETGTGKDYY